MGEPEPRLDGDAAVARSRGTLARSPLLQLTLARWREFYREPEALFWAFGFPLLMAIALGVAFQSRGPETTFVAVEDGPGAAEIARALDATPSLRAEVVPPNDARDRLRTGKVALAIVPPARPG